MPTVQLEAQISSDELLKAVQQLPPTELDKFVDQVLSLRAHHVTPSLPRTESELLLKINQGIPADLQKRYDELIGKRNAESLTESDHQELLVLTKQVEKIEVQRVEDLSELARIRHTSLAQLMQSLGLRTPEYA